MDMIGQNNLIQSNNKKIFNPDDIPLPRNKSIDKNKKGKNNETKNSIDEQVDKLMILLLEKNRDKTSLEL